MGRMGGPPTSTDAKWSREMVPAAGNADNHGVSEQEKFRRRVPHRPVCRATVARFVQDAAKRERWALGLAYGGLAAKTLVYLVLFIWASRTQVGAAALQGAVVADVPTFLLLGLLKLPTDGFEFTVDGAFEVALVLVYLARGALFDIPTDVEFAATSLLFFLLFVPVRVLLWGMDQVLDKS